MERLVVPLVRVIVVAERGVELHTGIEERLVRLLELLREILRPFRPVNVVAEHDGERERELGAVPEDLRCDFALLPLAGARVADHEEANRVRHRRKSHVLRGDVGRRADDQESEDGAESSDS